MKRSPLRRYKRINPVRSTPRNRKTVVRLKGEALTDLRYQCWRRDGMKCRNCGIYTYLNARYDGDPQAFDMAHIQSRGAGGSDILANVLTACHACHMAAHAGNIELQGSN